MYFSIYDQGYQAFRTVIHQRCVTGVIHGVMMPFACLGVAFLIRAMALDSDRNAAALKAANMIFGSWGFFWGLAAIQPCCNAGTLHCIGCEGPMLFAIFTATLYWSIVVIGLQLTAASATPSRLTDAKRGTVLFLIALGSMEFVGHWLLEGHGSDLSVVLNSVFHTPQYALRSLLGLEECSA